MDTVAKIEELMIERGMKSKTELEKLSGIPNGTLGKWSSGAYKPSLKSIEKLARFFDISPAVLLLPEPFAEYPNGQTDPNRITNPKIKKILRSLEDMTPEEIVLIDNIVDAVKKSRT